MIFHIAPAAAWEDAIAHGAYQADSLATEGFIHCSDRHQVIRVANERFRHRTDLVLLSIDAGSVEAPLRYENLEGGVEMFPHVYGALPVAAVVRTTPFRPNADGAFEHDQIPDLH